MKVIMNQIQPLQRTQTKDCVETPISVSSRTRWLVVQSFVPNEDLEYWEFREKFYLKSVLKFSSDI